VLGKLEYQNRDPKNRQAALCGSPSGHDDDSARVQVTHRRTQQLPRLGQMLDDVNKRYDIEARLSGQSLQRLRRDRNPLDAARPAAATEADAGFSDCSGSESRKSPDPQPTSSTPVSAAEGR